MGVSLIDVPNGHLAAVVTYLEMDRPPDRVTALASPLALHRVHPSPDEYRALFRLVGSPWLWFSRLVMDDVQLCKIVRDPAVELFAVRDGDGTVGMLELDRRVADACELAFVGLIATYTGRGHGRWLLAAAVKRAWVGSVKRIHVHTCSLDHPAALRAYQRAGFTARVRKVETFIDPRLAGILPRDAAPHVPLVEAGAIWTTARPSIEA